MRFWGDFISFPRSAFSGCAGAQSHSYWCSFQLILSWDGIFFQIFIVFQEMELQQVELGFARTTSPHNFSPPLWSGSSQVLETWQGGKTFLKIVVFFCTSSPSTNAYPLPSAVHSSLFASCNVLPWVARAISNATCLI